MEKSPNTRDLAFCEYCDEVLRPHGLRIASVTNYEGDKKPHIVLGVAIPRQRIRWVRSTSGEMVGIIPWLTT